MRLWHGLRRGWWSPGGGEIISLFHGGRTSVMKTYIIEIDAHEAYKKLGIDLRISPIADQCVQSLRQHLIERINTDLIITALADATKAGRSRRSRKPSGKPGEPNKEGHSHES